jgi:RNA-directed DNA polymerase
MKRIRVRIRELTGRRRCAGIKDIREVIAVLNPVLRGWGNCFRTGNAADKFIQIDRHVAWRLKRVLIKRKGRNLRAGEADRWTRQWFVGLGLHQLLGTFRYPPIA